MTELKRKRKPSKVTCVVKRPYRYTKEGSPMRKKGEVKLSPEEYEYALSLGLLEDGV